jgi:putative acetyltransferase
VLSSLARAGLDRAQPAAAPRIVGAGAALYGKAGIGEGMAAQPPRQGPVAQWLEPAAHNGLVGGSSPPGPTNVLRRSFDHALPRHAGLHTPEEDRWFFRERVFTTCQLWAYFDDNELIGIIAFREGWIDHLYVLPSSQGQGVGTALLQVAQGFHGNLSLWTFQRNAAARRFYEGRGFLLIKETDGFDNEEKEPDGMYSWKRDT